MRKLIIMLGVSGSGKSTWIKRRHLEDYVVSADAIRKNLGYSTVSVIDGQIEPIMNSTHEKEVWRIFHQMLESRMYHGITTIVDNTDTNFSAFKPLRKLAKKYNYDVLTIDFMAEHTYADKKELKKNIQKVFNDFELKPKLDHDGKKQILNFIMERNHARVAYQVPDDVIRKQLFQYTDLWRRISENPADWKWINQASTIGDKARVFIKRDPVVDLDQYKKIQVIGDIHNDYSALMKVFDEHEKGTAYIFLGDYLDKGTRPYSTFEFLTEELGGSNLYFLRGNHEDLWARWLYTGKVSPQFEKTLDVLLIQYGEEKLKKIMTRMLAQMKDYMIFEFHGRFYYASHAGFEPAMVNKDLNLLPSSAFTYGLSTGFDVHNPYGRDIDSLWAKTPYCVDYNLHGHRNNFGVFVEGTSVNLNYEGEFRWATIDREGVHAKKITSIDAPSFENALADDPVVYTKNQSDGITSFNFTPTAFVRQRWNQHTSNARGLFIRKRDHKIVGRGFPKFFEIGQVPTAYLKYLEFPVNVLRKHDGFLTIVCFDKATERIHVYSKAGETNMADLAKEDLIKTGYMRKIEDYYEDYDVRDTSLLFETVDPVNDMHVIKYTKLHIYPIAIIANNRQGAWISEKPDDKHKDNKTFNAWRELEINSGSWLATVDADDDSEQAKLDAVKRLERVIRDDQDMNPYREGVVLYGQNMMLKVKTPFFHKSEELQHQLILRQSRGDFKDVWKFGAKSWAEFCVNVGEFDYTPDLPLKLERFDEKYNIKKQNSLVRNNPSNATAVKKLWQNFK